MRTLRAYLCFALMVALFSPSCLPMPAHATVSTTAPRNDYIGNGATATYSYTFKIFAATDLRVTTRNTSNVETALVYPTDYTVTGAGSSSGGTITLTAGNLTSGYALTIRFDRTPRQSTDLRNQGTFYPETHEDKFDELTRYSQQIKDVVDRSLHLSETEAGTSTTTTLPALAERKGNYLAFDSSTGQPIAAQSVTGVTASAFMQTVLDDATAAQARTTLDVTQAINSLTAETAPAAGDLLPLYDVSASADRKMTLSNMLKVVNDLSEDTTPDQANDFLLTYDASAAGAKKAKPNNVIPAATTSVSGRVTIAAQSDVNAMTDTAKVLTPNLNKIVLGTSVASTSGTSIDFTGIPAGVRRITMMLDGASSNGTSDWIFQVGDSGGIETSGYLGSMTNIGAGVVTANYTAGHGVTGVTAASVVHGTITLTLMNASTFTWAITSSVGRSDAAVIGVGASTKSLSAELDRVRLTTAGGANTFDAGSINIIYER